MGKPSTPVRWCDGLTVGGWEPGASARQVLASGGFRGLKAKEIRVR